MMIEMLIIALLIIAFGSVLMIIETIEIKRENKEIRRILIHKGLFVNP